ncbi:hypothetical protein [Macrococcus brunensis]|uniref:hypothetical protein n=1 Tax=Macrococcus brunensis TaxID=198483 RepID=UPI001EEF8853|nr:hypothetical protein [Macrococcus brunensis]ULG71508.1 hypothetical protein MGG12_09255 [Macrococcus brunensis]
MKRLMIVATASLLLTACSNEDKMEETVSQKSVELKTEEATTETKVTETKKSEPSTEDQTTEPVEENEVKSVEQSEDISYITQDGKVDILSKDFINDYFYRNHINEFGSITIGMPINEVEKLYGQSSGPGRAAQYPTTGKFGDIALDYPDGHVENIFINPSMKVAKSQVEAAYGMPTEIEASAPLSSDHDIYIYDSNKNNGYKIVVLFEGEQVVLIQQLPENENQSNEANQTFTEDEKLAMTQAFYHWAGERAEIGNMAVTDEWFTHGAAGRGDWYAETPDGDVQSQNLENPGHNGFQIHAIGGVAFYTAKDGSTGQQRTNGSTADGYSRSVKPGTDIHKYLLADNGVVYELIGPADQVGFTTGFGEYEDDGTKGDFRPQMPFEISADQAAQTKWQEILSQYQ